MKAKLNTLLYNYVVEIMRIITRMGNLDLDKRENVM